MEKTYIREDKEGNVLYPLSKTEYIFHKTERLYNLVENFISDSAILKELSKSFESAELTINNNTQEIDSLKDKVDIDSNNMIYVKKYGAKGDGVNDDTLAIQKALDNGEGKTVILEDGIYLISNTLTIKKNTTFIGNGLTSIIYLKSGANCDVLKSENFDLLKGTDTHDCNIKNITIKDIVFNGNHYNSPESYDFKVNNLIGHGLQFYCGNLRLQNVFITNTPYNGLYTEWNTFDSPNNNLYGSEGKFDNLIIQYSGRHGWENRGSHDSIASNIIISTSSCETPNKYCNYYGCKKSNFKLTNGHFYSQYGEMKPKYSVFLEREAYSYNFTNCHIEGAMDVPLRVLNSGNTFTNCFVYASFGSYDVSLCGHGNIFDKCRFMNKADDGSGISSGEWKGALNFEEGTELDNRNNYFNVYLDDTYLTKDFSCTNYLNTYIINGYNNKYTINGEKLAMLLDMNDKNKSDNIQITGDFGSQSVYSHTPTESVVASPKQYSQLLEKMTKGETCKILVVGDSISKGYKNTYPYSTILQTILSKYYNNNNIVIDNKAIIGETSYSLINSLNNITENYDYCLLMIGVNDVANYLNGSQTLDKFDSNLNECIKILSNKEIGISLCTMTPCLGDDRYIQQSFNQKIKEIGNKNNIPIIDVYNSFIECYKKLIFKGFIQVNDMQHINDEAQKILISTIATHLNVNTIDYNSYIPVTKAYCTHENINNYYNNESIDVGNSIRIIKGTTGKYIKTSFVSNSKSCELYLNGITYSDNGTFNVTVDGVNYPISETTDSIEYNKLIKICDLSYGYHDIVITDNNYISGGTQFDVISFYVKTL